MGSYDDMVGRQKPAAALLVGSDPLVFCFFFSPFFGFGRRWFQLDEVPLNFGGELHFERWAADAGRPAAYMHSARCHFRSPFSAVQTVNRTQLRLRLPAIPASTHVPLSSRPSRSPLDKSSQRREKRESFASATLVAADDRSIHSGNLRQHPGTSKRFLDK